MSDNALASLSETNSAVAKTIHTLNYMNGHHQLKGKHKACQHIGDAVP